MPFHKMVMDEHHLQDDTEKFYFFKKKSAHVSIIITGVFFLACILFTYYLSKSSSVDPSNEIIEDQFCQNFFCNYPEKTSGKYFKLCRKFKFSSLFFKSKSFKASVLDMRIILYKIINM
jgi:hypothetical protein